MQGACFINLMNRVDAAVILTPKHKLDSIGYGMLMGDGEDELNFPNFFIVVGFKRVEYGEFLVPRRPSVNAVGNSRAVVESAVVYPETRRNLRRSIGVCAKSLVRTVSLTK